MLRPGHFELTKANFLVNEVFLRRSFTRAVYVYVAEQMD